MSSTQRSVISYPYSTSTLYPYTTGNSPADPYYSNVSLLMPMNGTNNSTTLLDYSYNQKTIDNPAGATISTSKFKFGGSSLFFDGVNDTISITNSYDFDFGANDFTIEMWVNRLGAGTGDRFLISRNNGTDFLLRWQSGGNLQFYINATLIITHAFAFTIDQWYHLAVVRNGNTFTLFVDGTTVATGTSASAITYTSASPVLIGGYTTGDQYNGYMDDLRITKGIARYTSSFTPPTIANPNFGSWYDNNYSNVVLLLHMDGSNGSTVFTDNSSSPKSITAVGNAQISTTIKKYGTGSLSLDGSGDYLTSPNSTAFDFGTDNFTVEGWARANASTFSTTKWLISNRPSIVPDNGFAVVVQSTGKLSGLVWTNGVVQNIQSPTIGISANDWFHWAFVWDGSTYKVFQNGQLVASAARTISPANSTGLLYVGSSSLEDGTRDWPGYIDDVRITKGVARYTSNFIPSKLAFPDGPSSADPYYSNVTLLLPFNGTNTSTSFTDVSRTASIFTAQGNAQISTTQFKFGGSSLYLDGTGDWIQTTTGLSSGVLGSGDFTVEGWVYPTVAGKMIYDFGYTTTTPAGGWELWITATQKLEFYRSGTGTVVVTSSTNVNLNQWSHVAAVRASGTITLYINGTASGSALNSTNYNTTGVTIFAIGAQVQTRNAAYDWNGYMDNLRITPGIALYTSNFTVPVRPNPTTGIPYDNYYDNVSLLLHLNGANGGTSFVDSSLRAKTVTTNGNALTSTTQYKYGVSSGYFDGTGDYLSLTYNNDLNFTGTDFTIEGWAYYESTIGTYGTLIDFRGSDAFNVSWGIFINKIDRNLNIYDGPSQTTNIYTSLNSIPVNDTWFHWAAVRSGATVTLYINGVASGPGSSLNYNPPATSSTGVRIGLNQAGSDGWKGYMDDIRITNGVARYTSTFTPPTQAFSDQAPIFDSFYSNVSLLLPLTGTNGSTTFVDNSPISKVVTPTGNTQISTTQWKWGGSSVYFDGNGDYLSVPANSGFNFGTGDFTIECWFYTSSTTQTFGKRILNKYDYLNPGDYGWLLECFRTVGSLRFMLFNSSGTLVVDLVSNTSVSANIWNHVAVSRNKEKIYLFLNGKSVAENLSMIGSDDYSTSLNIGAQTITAPTGTFFDGYINDVRISKGVARYLNNFTPPRRPFPNQ